MRLYASAVRRMSKCKPRLAFIVRIVPVATLHHMGDWKARAIIGTRRRRNATDDVLCQHVVIVVLRWRRQLDDGTSGLRHLFNRGEEDADVRARHMRRLTWSY